MCRRATLTAGLASQAFAAHELMTNSDSASPCYETVCFAIGQTLDRSNYGYGKIVML
jgi:hypothetical protein